MSRKQDKLFDFARKNSNHAPKHESQTVRIADIKAPKTAAVGQSLTIEASQFIPTHTTDAQKKSVSWCVLYSNWVVDRFVHHGQKLEYVVPYFLVVGPRSNYVPHRSPFIESKSNFVPMVKSSLRFKAYGTNEAEGITRTVHLEPSYERFDAISDFLFNQMHENVRGKDAEHIKKWFSLADHYFKLEKSANERGDHFSGNWVKAAGELIRCYGRFAVLIHSGGPWDHKKYLRENHHASQDAWLPFRGDTTYEHYYDIWSNVHFGYVGRALGFQKDVLMYLGGGELPPVAQQIPAVKHFIESVLGVNDEGDRISIEIGVELWQKHGMKLSKDDLLKALGAAHGKYVQLFSTGQSKKSKDFEAISKLKFMANGY